MPERKLQMKKMTWMGVGLLLTGCSAATLTSSAIPQARPRVMAQVTGETLEVKVIVEGKEGNSLNAAVVALKDPSHGVTFLDYDSRKNAYVYAGKSMPGDFEVETNSVQGEQKVQFPVFQLEHAPEVQTIQDGQENRVWILKPLKLARPSGCSGKVPLGQTSIWWR